VFRDTDYLVRWGGEEFLVIVRFVDRNKGPILAERFREMVEQFDFDIDMEKHSILRALLDMLVILS